MAGPFTTIPVHPATLQRIKQYKTAGANYDDVVNQLLDQVPLDEFVVQQMRSQRDSTFIDWDAARAAMGKQ